MRIAVTYENENIFQHFGHTEQFKIYDVDGSDITDSPIAKLGRKRSWRACGIFVRS